MAGYITRRLAAAIPLLVGVSIVLFALIHLPPGGPADIYAGAPGVTQEDLENINKNLGLDGPLYVQYFKWMRGVITWDWGNSYKDGRPVTAVLADRLPATLELMISASLIAITIALPIGIYTATRAGKVSRYVVNAFTMFGISVPTFWTGLVVILVFSGKLGWIPTGGRGTEGFGDTIRHLLAPACVLASANIAAWARYVHSSMIEAIHADYVRTARAKGLRENTVVLRHAFRNASMPIITLLGLEVPKLVSGALVTEVVFSWPGAGRLITESILGRDYPVLMGVFLLAAIGVVLGNLLADIVYGLVNPTVRY